MKPEIINEKPKLGRPVSIKKQESILKSARALFHKHGFDGVTMDEIAKKAGVVKATLYNQFNDKENLFIQMMQNSIQGLDSQVNIDEMMIEKNISEILTEIGEKLIVFLESDEVRNSQRLIIMQADRHKKLAELFMENGPLRIKNLIKQILQKAKDRGEIKINDSERKASYFMMILINMNSFEMLMGLAKKRDKETIKQDVKSAVAFFLNGLDS